MRHQRVPEISDRRDLYGSLLADSSVVATFLVSDDGEVIAANALFAALAGAATATALIGRPILDLITDRRDWPAWRDAALAGRERRVTITIEGAHRQPVVLRGDLSPATATNGTRKTEPAALIGMFVDVTEELNLRNAVQRSAHMEALGSLTSGIAHDFNNLLTVLVGNLYLVAEELREHPKSFAKLKSARDAAKRGADLIRQLLAFAKREAVDTDVVDPSDIVRRLEPLLSRALGQRIELNLQLQPDVGSTRCNAAQLESVLVNLAVNARDAIENSGTIRVSLESVHLPAEGAKPHGIESGSYLKLAVADNGAGIPQVAVNRVFEPFFTTKGDRGGTGLGLSMVRWFAQQARGAVYIDSAPSKGTTVTILLPKSADSTAETSAKTMPLSTLPTGNERVLVFAHEESIRSTIKQILEVLGYEVHLSTVPSEALNAVRLKQIDVLLVDAAAQQAPAQRHLLREAVAARPGLKVIVTADNADQARARLSNGVAVLAKPFSLADLAGTVRKVLNQPPSK